MTDEMLEPEETGNLVVQVGEAQAGQRLDKIVSELVPDATRSAVQKWVEQGFVTKQGKPLAKSARLCAGDEIEIQVPEPVSWEVEPQDIPLEICYEDADVLVVNKPKGMVVHPAPGHPNGTLVNALLYHCGDSLSGINGVIRPGIVHRIDKDTSGLLMVAKNDAAHQSLAAQIQDHSFTRMYEAVVYGNLKEDSGTVDAPIGRHPTDRKRMAVTEHHSRRAVTHYDVLGRYRGFTHVRLRLETGRTHQIRVHMAYLGHPVAGDLVYGVKKGIASLQGQCLHAKTLGFRHPSTGEYLEITSGLPDYFRNFLAHLP